MIGVDHKKDAEKNMLPPRWGDVADTTIEDGIKNFIDWYREFYGV